LTEFLRSADYVLANLEGPITQEKSISQFSQPGETKNFVFTFSEAIISTLIKNNLTLLHLGNNHILNFGAQGLTSTKESLTQANLISFGNVSENLQSTEASNRFYLLEKFGQKIALISYNQFMTNGKNATLADLKTVQAAGANLIILYTHWGNEYQEKAPAVIVELAHEFIDAGVDLIIGSHPHVIQNKEIYQNKTIYYSLGNFVFDQYFSAETASGLLLKIDFVFDTNTKLWSYRVSEQMIKMSTDGKTYLLEQR
jgi:poly-gamma-glutamate synthesis protein (capsule biosynthesis protein)